MLRCCNGRAGGKLVISLDGGRRPSISRPRPKNILCFWLIGVHYNQCSCCSLPQHRSLRLHLVFPVQDRMRSQAGTFQTSCEFQELLISRHAARVATQCEVSQGQFRRSCCLLIGRASNARSSVKCRRVDHGILALVQRFRRHGLCSCSCRCFSYEKALVLAELAIVVV